MIIFRLLSLHSFLSASHLHFYRVVLHSTYLVVRLTRTRETLPIVHFSHAESYKHATFPFSALKMKTAQMYALSLSLSLKYIYTSTMLKSRKFSNMKLSSVCVYCVCLNFFSFTFAFI